MNTVYRLIACLFFPLSFLITSTAEAAGFQIQEQNVAHLGLAYSGTGALAEDASSAFYNPAGLSRLKGSQVAISNVLIHSHAQMRPQIATSSWGAPLSGNLTGDNPGGLIPLPSFHVGTKISEEWAFGFSVAAPFGLRSEYHKNTSPARYVALESELKAINFGPSLAYAVSPKLSVAAGPDLQRATVTLDTATGLGGGPIADGFVNHTLAGWARGFHVGALYEPRAGARFSLHYRSKMHYNGVGDYHFRDPFSEAKAKTFGRLTLPESIVASTYFQFSEAWTWLADVQWTRWNRFRELRLRYDENDLMEKVVPENFKNTLRLATGLNYTANESWTWRVGFAYDETPTVTANRTARIPDEDRIWLAFGTHYHFNKRMSFDMGYARLFFKEIWVDDKGPIGTNARFMGSYRAYANLLGVQMNVNF